MATLIAVCHSGLVITNEIASYEFVGINETFLNEFVTLENLVGLVLEWLGWMDDGCEVHRIDIGQAMALG
jgi:hypothetical protein